jgi:hypothetical protein
MTNRHWIRSTLGGLALLFLLLSPEAASARVRPGDSGDPSPSPCAITFDPDDVTVCKGEMVVLIGSEKTNQTGTTATWQVSTDNGETWTPFTGAAPSTTSTSVSGGFTVTSTLSFTASAEQNGHRFRVVFDDACAVRITQAALVTVNLAPAVTAHPSSRTTFCAGQSVSFVATATGTPAPSVQWQVSTDGGLSFDDLGGETSPTLTFTPTAADNGKQYHAVFTNPCGTETTRAATLTTGSLTVTAGGDRQLCPGESLTLPRNGTPSGGTYRWTFPKGEIVSTDGTIILQPEAVQSGTYLLTYTVNGCTATDSMKVTVNPGPMAVVSGATTICAGQSATLSVALTGSAPWSITWNDGLVQSGIQTSPATRAVNPTSTTTYALTAVSDATCTGTSSGSAAVTVNTPPGITAPIIPTLSADASQCTAAVAAFSPTVTGTPTPTVSYSVKGQPISLPYAFSAGSTEVTAVASNGCGPDASCTFTVTVVDDQPPTITGCPGDQELLATCLAGGLFGAIASFDDPTAADNCGSVSVTCTAPLGPGGADIAVTSGITAFPAGSTPVTFSAVDLAGKPATCSFTVSVAYEWSGILQPINADGSSVFKAGSTVPVKFALTGASACITNAVATLSYAKVSSGVAGAVNEAVSTSAATEGNQFRYTSGQYIFNWSTKGLSPGTYQLQINLGDGVARTITVGLR